MFLLKSPHQCDSNKYTQYTIFTIKKIPEIIPKMQLWEMYTYFLRMSLFLLANVVILTVYLTL